MVSGGMRVGHNREVVLLAGFYGAFVLVALLNLLLMRRPGRLRNGPEIVFLIPARNEAENLPRLLDTLVPQGKVIVFDDESTDGTGDIARNHGATVIQPREPLPEGWTGKNRACHELAKAASEATDAQWLVFLDADVYPEPDFADAVRDLANGPGRQAGVITGFPGVIPGQGIEPMFLAWVGWILLATNPFGLVSRSGVAHNRFTNGQFHAWRRDVYTKIWPNERVKGAVLEDVKMGRLCAKEGIRVEVANVSSVLRVRMYETWRQTLDGMSKNSFEIVGSAAGTYAFAGLFLVIGWGWLAFWPTYFLLIFSAFLVVATVRSWRTVWVVPLAPIAMTIGAFTLVRSVAWRKRGTVTWKGRTYPNAKG